MRGPWTVALVLASACAPHHPATSAECAQLVDQIVALELRQAGFRDPLLEKLRAGELRQALGPQLEACRRLTLADGALDCAHRAGSAQALAHQCLR